MELICDSGGNYEMKPAAEQIFESGCVFVQDNVDIEGDRQNVPMSVHVTTRQEKNASDKSVTNLPTKSVNDATNDVNVRGAVSEIEIVTNPTPAYQNAMVLRNRSVKSQKTDDSKKRKNRQVPPQDELQNLFGIDGLN